LGDDYDFENLLDTDVKLIRWLEFQTLNSNPSTGCEHECLKCNSSFTYESPTWPSTSEKSHVDRGEKREAEEMEMGSIKRRRYSYHPSEVGGDISEFNWEEINHRGEFHGAGVEDISVNGSM
jgi:hypothetical protein